MKVRMLRALVAIGCGGFCLQANCDQQVAEIFAASATDAIVGVAEIRVESAMNNAFGLE